MIFRARVKICLTLIAVFLAIPNGSRGAELAVDWVKLEHEAASILSRYIQIDTTNPLAMKSRRPSFSRRSLIAKESKHRLSSRYPGALAFMLSYTEMTRENP